MKVLYLGPNNNSVYSFLNNKYKTQNTEEKLDPSTICKFDWVVSYGYRHILKKEHILKKIVSFQKILGIKDKIELKFLSERTILLKCIKKDE